MYPFLPGSNGAGMAQSPVLIAVQGKTLRSAKKRKEAPQKP
jgi:hypothetical protein